MRHALARAFLAASLVLGAAACGGMLEEEEVLVELPSLQDADGHADDAGGRYVKVKGAITKGRTRTGAFVGRDSAYGYTVTAARGETLVARGLSAFGTGLTAIFGPQSEDGSWGPQRAKVWTIFPTERGVPTVGYKAPKAGKYLIVLSVSSRTTTAADMRFALTACANGECLAGGCGEWSNDDLGAHWAFNFVSREEAELVVNTAGRATKSARSGACGEQPTTCPTSRAPVCTTGLGPTPITHANICKAKVALRAQVSTGSNAHGWIGTAPGACSH